MGGSLLSDFFDDDRFFSSPWLGERSMPAVNIRETEKTYEVELAAPGYQKKDFNIEIDNGVLTVSAEKQEEKEDKDKDGSYTRREFGYRSFARSFNLPANTNEEDIRARYEDGILRLDIAKRGENGNDNRKAIRVQ